MSLWAGLDDEGDFQADTEKERDELVGAVDRDIRELTEERTFYAWDEASTLADRIGWLCRAILDGFLDWAPVTAASLLGKLVETSGTVMERVDDSSGSVGHAYGEVIKAYGAARVAVGPRDHYALAALVLHELATDDYGVKGDILSAFREALGQAGLLELRRLIQVELEREPADSDYRRGNWHHALKDVADALGDVDGFIAAVAAAAVRLTACRSILPPHGGPPATGRRPPSVR